LLQNISFFIHILIQGTGVPSVDGGKWGLKPDQGMTMRRLRVDGCLVLNKKSCVPAIVFL